MQMERCLPVVSFLQPNVSSKWLDIVKIREGAKKALKCENGTF